MKTVSIIVPVYNVEEYLPKCVESILNQTFSDYELILVDDGSTDNSGKLCDKYALTDDRIKVIHKQNGGLSSARNAGIEIMSGDFVSFIDSDDFIDANMFEVLLKVQSQCKADVVICGFTREIETVEYREDMISPVKFSGINYLKYLFTTTGREFTNGISAWAKLYKSSLFEEVRYPDGYVFEDEGTTHKLYLKSNTIVQIKAPFYHYIKRENSIITTLRPRQICDKQYSLWTRFLDLSLADKSFSRQAARMFYVVSYSTLLSAYKNNDSDVYKQAKKLFLQSKKSISPYLDKYGKIYIRLLSFPLTEKWLMKNNFEPLQNIIRKL